MEKIFALYASSNKGKTTTLNILIDLLAVVSDKYNIWREYEGWAWFIIKNKTISVCTSGDNANTVKNNIKDYKDCDIFISDSRTKGGSVNEIEKLSKSENLKIEWIEKEDNPKKNKEIAADLFRRIMNELF